MVRSGGTFAAHVLLQFAVAVDVLREGCHVSRLQKVRCGLHAHPRSAVLELWRLLCVVKVATTGSSVAAVIFFYGELSFAVPVLFRGSDSRTYIAAQCWSWSARLLIVCVSGHVSDFNSVKDG